MNINLISIFLALAIVMGGIFTLLRRRRTKSPSIPQRPGTQKPTVERRPATIPECNQALQDYRHADQSGASSAEVEKLYNRYERMEAERHKEADRLREESRRAHAASSRTAERKTIENQIKRALQDYRHADQSGASSAEVEKLWNRYKRNVMEKADRLRESRRAHAASSHATSSRTTASPVSNTDHERPSISAVERKTIEKQIEKANKEYEAAQDAAWRYGLANKACTMNNATERELKRSGSKTNKIWTTLKAKRDSLEKRLQDLKDRLPENRLPFYRPPVVDANGNIMYRKSFK